MVKRGCWDRVKRIIDDVTDVLYQDQFTAREFACDHITAHSRIQKLRNCDAISKVDETCYERPGSSNSKQWLNVYEWDAEIQGRAQQYLEDRDELPCGCRSHVPAETDANGRYVCKFCESKHTESVIRNAL